MASQLLALPAAQPCREMISNQIALFLFCLGFCNAFFPFWCVF